MVFGLNQTHGFTRMIVKMIVALFKEKKAFSLLKATIILTIILVKPCIWLKPNTDFTFQGNACTFWGEVCSNLTARVRRLYFLPSEWWRGGARGRRKIVFVFVERGH